MPEPPGWRPSAHAVWPTLDLQVTPTASLFPYGCRICGRTLNYDEVEHCEDLGGTVHAECHSEKCMNPSCAYLTCTSERCDSLTECATCGEPLCEQHRGDQLFVTEDGEQFHDFSCI